MVSRRGTFRRKKRRDHSLYTRKGEETNMRNEEESRFMNVFSLDDGAKGSRIKKKIIIKKILVDILVRAAQSKLPRPIFLS